MKLLTIKRLPPTSLNLTFLSSQAFYHGREYVLGGTGVDSGTYFDFRGNASSSGSFNQVIDHCFGFSHSNDHFTNMGLPNLHAGSAYRKSVKIDPNGDLLANGSNSQQFIFFTRFIAIFDSQLVLSLVSHQTLDELLNEVDPDKLEMWYEERTFNSLLNSNIIRSNQTPILPKIIETFQQVNPDYDIPFKAKKPHEMESLLMDAFKPHETIEDMEHFSTNLLKESENYARLQGSGGY